MQPDDKSQRPWVTVLAVRRWAGPAMAQHSDPASGDLAGHAEPGFHLLPARVPVTAREPGPSRLSARHRDCDRACRTGS